MEPETLQLVREVIIMLIGGGIGFITQHFRSPSAKRQAETQVHDDHQRAQMETIEIQGRTLNDAWERIETLSAKVLWLEGQLRMYAVGYGKALSFINENLPDKEIPNFLDTKPPANKGGTKKP